MSKSAVLITSISITTLLLCIHVLMVFTTVIFPIGPLTPELVLLALYASVVFLVIYSAKSLLGEQREHLKMFEALVGTLGHDLRTPLQTLQSSVSLLGGDLAVRERPVFAAHAISSIASISRQIDDIVRLTRGQDFPYTVGATDVRKWFENLVSIYSPKARAKGLKWSDSCPAQLPMLEVDADRLAQCVSLLVDNAIRYSAAGQIELVLVFRVTPGDTSGQGELVITVKDTGIGIAMKDRSSIFEPFKLPSSGHGKRMRVGLAIASQIAKSASGRLTFESEEGGGTTFTLSVPVKVGQIPESIPETAKPNVKEINDDVGAEVLLVDTDHKVFSPLMALLVDAGFDVVCVNTEAQALDRIASAPYGVVVSYIKTDIVNGFTYADRKKRPAERPHFIAIKAKDSLLGGDRVSLFDAVIDPFGPQEVFLDAVESCLKK